MVRKSWVSAKSNFEKKNIINIRYRQYIILPWGISDCYRQFRFISFKIINQFFPGFNYEKFFEFIVRKKSKNSYALTLVFLLYYLRFYFLAFSLVSKIRPLDFLKKSSLKLTVYK